MKKIMFLFILIFSVQSCAELQQLASQIPADTLSDADIARGLKTALEQGIDKEVSTLMKEGGFYNQKDVRILFPPELRTVEQRLRDLGFNSLVDQAEMKLNRAAEEAVKEAKPVFVQAIREMTFDDARKILMGDQKAATEYLKRKTENQLYQKFYPIVRENFSKVGADKIWSDLISRYNSLPLVQPVNTDLNDYVTREALKGVYKKIADEEVKIRTDISERTNDLLRRVFALQDQRKNNSNQPQQ